MEAAPDPKNNIAIGDPRFNYDSTIKPIEETKRKHFSSKENE